MRTNFLHIRLSLFAAIMVVMVSCSTRQNSMEKILSKIQDPAQTTCDQFIYALYHTDGINYPLDKETLEPNRTLLTDKCLSKLSQSYEEEYSDGGGYAFWDLFGGSNTSVWGSYRGMNYTENGWYCLRFVFEEYSTPESSYCEDAPTLYLKVIQQDGRWMVDDYRVEGKKY